jgi:hypothetical protein
MRAVVTRRAFVGGGVALVLAAQSVDAQKASMTFGDAIAVLATNRSQAEQAAALLKRYRPDDAQGRQLYADAKAKFDGFISGLAAGIASEGNATISAALQQSLNNAVASASAFGAYVKGVVQAMTPAGGKSPMVWAALLADPAKLFTSLTEAGLAIFGAASKATKEKRGEMVQRVEQERWRLFGDIPMAS